MVRILNFDEAIKSKQHLILSPGCKTEIDCIFNDLRVRRDTVPEGYYLYDIRGGGESLFCTIEDSVLVDHSGSLITTKPIPMKCKGIGGKAYRTFTGRGGYTLS